MKQKTVQILSIALFVGLLTWGVWTLLYYLGVPVHGSVLLDEASMKELEALCTTNSFSCRGLYALFPFIGHTLTRVPFFIWYAVICAALFGIALLVGFLKTNRIVVEWTMKPWKLLLIFLGMVWLIFLCLSFSVDQNNNLSFRTIVEPRQEVYSGAGQEALQALAINYTNLKERGCLERIGVFGGVAEASNIKLRCLQSAFFTRVLPQALLILLLVFELLVAGRLVLRRVLRLLPEEPLSEFVLSLGLGAGVWIVTLWIGALLGIYTALFGWGLIVGVVCIGYKDARYWLQKFLSATWRVSTPWYSAWLLLCWFLLSYLAFNFINVVRPFPIGWDDLGSYLNRPRLLVSYGTFIHSMSSFQWEYLTSLGYLLFGYDSVFGATASMMINWFQGVLAILSIYLFGRTFMGPGRGVLAALLYYTLPIVGHFSFADMKIDNAVFAAGGLATFCLFYAFFYSNERRKTWVLLAGIFVGFAFSFKITAIMVFMALGAVLMGLALHWTAFVGSLFMVLAVYTENGALNIPRIAERLDVGGLPSPMLLFAFFLLIGLSWICVAGYLRRDRIKQAALLVFLFVGGFIIVIYPWIQHNSFLRGNILPGMSVSAPNSLTPKIDMFGTSDTAQYSLPPELAVTQSDPNCKATSGTEELDRYWGNATGWGHYLMLPWRSVMNLDHAGYYVTSQPAVLLFVLVLLLPALWKASGSYIRYLWGMTLFLVVEWAFLANGVPWYGIGMFFGVVILVEVLIARAPDAFSRSVAATLVTLSILMCLGMRLWQFESQKNLFEYAIGKVSAETLQERTIPYYDDIRDIVMTRYATMPDRPLLYRIGTFIPYFIPKNLEVIGVTDHQLDTFNCLYQDEDNAKTLQRIKALGFNAIIFDTNTATIEKDPNGSLHKKVAELTRFLNSEEAGLEVIFYDPGAGIAFLLIP